MQAAKKIEVIVSEIEVPKVVKALDKLKVQGYTVIGNVSGRGSSGVRSDDLLTNAYIMTVCSDNEYTEKIVAALKPILDKLGGICTVTDTMLMSRVECH
jgi:nitrogen regulatory protein PII